MKQARSILAILLFGCAVMFAAIILSQLPERRKGAV